MTTRPESVSVGDIVRFKEDLYKVHTKIHSPKTLIGISGSSGTFFIVEFNDLWLVDDQEGAKLIWELQNESCT